MGPHVVPLWPLKKQRRIPKGWAEGVAVTGSLPPSGTITHSSCGLYTAVTGIKVGACEGRTLGTSLPHETHIHRMSLEAQTLLAGQLASHLIHSLPEYFTT